MFSLYYISRIFKGPTSPSYTNISTTQSHPTAAATTRHPAGAIVASKVVEKNENSTKKVTQTTAYPKVITPSRINDQQTSSSEDSISDVPNAHATEAVTEPNGENQHEAEVGNKDTVKQSTVNLKVTTPSKTNDRQEDSSEVGNSETPSPHETEAVIEHNEDKELETEVGTEGRDPERGENGTNATFDRLVMGKNFAPKFYISINGLLVYEILFFLSIILF